MFLRGIGLLLVYFGWMAVALAHVRWMERMMAQVNKGRPPSKQIPVIGAGPFKGAEARREMRRVDPIGYRRGLVRFAISGLILTTAMFLLLKGF